MANNSSIVVRFAAEFEKELYRLSRKYRSIKKDVEPIIERLQEGELLGDRLSGLTSNLYISKVRVKNSDIQKGKSAGYRLIYLVESTTSILLLAIYSKSERSDITGDEIQSILDNFYSL